MILALVRHGETDFNKQRLVQGRINNPLNETGLKQAKIAAQFIKKHKLAFDFIAVSPLSRALQTAHVIAKKVDFKRPLYVCPYLVERDFSPFDGKDIDEVFPVIKNPKFEHPLYESDEAMIDRASYAIEILQDKFGDQSGLVVAHSHLIKAILNLIDPEKFSFTGHYIKNGEVNVIEVTNDEIKYLYRLEF